MAFFCTLASASAASTLAASASTASTSAASASAAYDGCHRTWPLTPNKINLHCDEDKVNKLALSGFSQNELL